MKVINYADLVLTPVGWRASGMINGKFKVTLPIERVRCTSQGVEIVTKKGTYELARGTKIFSDDKLAVMLDWYKEREE